MYLFLRMSWWITKVQICNMSHFTSFGMRNLQYKIETCHKIDNKGTTSWWLIKVTIFLHKWNRHYLCRQNIWEIEVKKLLTAVIWRIFQNLWDESTGGHRYAGIITFMMPFDRQTSTIMFYFDQFHFRFRKIEARKF